MGERDLSEKCSNVSSSSESVCVSISTSSSDVCGVVCAGVVLSCKSKSMACVCVLGIGLSLGSGSWLCSGDVRGDGRGEVFVSLACW